MPHDQKDLAYHLTPTGQDMFFDFSHPIWKCPNCGDLNRLIDGFGGDTCLTCMVAPEDWTQHIADPEVKADWEC